MWYGIILIGMFIVGLCSCMTAFGKILLKFSILIMFLGLVVFFVKDDGDWQEVHESKDKSAYLTKEEKKETLRYVLFEEKNTIENKGWFQSYDDGFEINVPEKMFYCRTTDRFYYNITIRLMNAGGNPDRVDEKTFDPMYLLIVPVIIIAPFFGIYLFITWISRGIFKDFTGLGG